MGKAEREMEMREKERWRKEEGGKGERGRKGGRGGRGEGNDLLECILHQETSDNTHSGGQTGSANAFFLQRPLVLSSGHYQWWRTL